MAKRARSNSNPADKAITWKRVRAIFGNPEPPKEVWECQFDGFNDELQKLARTPYDEIDCSDLWYYHHDLAYVELQPDLFDYLFPVCLMDWHITLKNNTGCSHGDSEFHYGIHHGRVFDRMLSPRQQEEVFKVLRDSFLERLDEERGFLCIGAHAPAHGWMHRFNSIGLILPRIKDLWEIWWALETPGQAVAALEYCSGFMYLEGSNPLFGAWTPDNGGGGPYLWENDSQIHDSGWMQENIDFLTSTLTPKFVDQHVKAAVERLRGEPECEKARQIESDFSGNHEWISVQDLIASRTAELPLLLSNPKVTQWTI